MNLIKISQNFDVFFYKIWFDLTDFSLPGARGGGDVKKHRDKSYQHRIRRSFVDQYLFVSHDTLLTDHSSVTYVCEVFVCISIFIYRP